MDSDSDLARQNAILQSKNEQLQQEVYEYKRDLKTKQQLYDEYLEEIKSAQAEIEAREKQLQLKNQELERQNSATLAKCNERVNCLEKELLQKEEENEKLEKKVQELLRVEQVTPNQSDLLQENENLKNLNEILEERISELQNVVLNNESQNIKMEKAFKDLECDLQQYKESLNLKQSDLREANSMIQTLKDDYFFVKSELDSVKSQPLEENSKGNSLFAEVNDRRVELQKNMKAMKTKYLEMKQKYSSVLEQVKRARNEKLKIMEQLKAETEGKEYDKKEILQCHKNEIECLNELIKSYQAELKEKVKMIKTLPGLSEVNTMKFYEEMLEMKDAELEKLRVDAKCRASVYVGSIYEQIEINEKMRKCTIENLELRHEIDLLKTELENVENQSSKIKELENEINTLKTQLEIEIANNKIIKESQEKENICNEASKSVRFAEDTILTDGDKLKSSKGRKVTCMKPVIFS